MFRFVWQAHGFQAAPRKITEKDKLLISTKAAQVFAFSLQGKDKSDMLVGVGCYS